MKVRIGISLGPAAVPAVFGDAVDRLEELGVDSLWLSEMVFGSLVEPSPAWRTRCRDPATLIPVGWAAARHMIEQYVTAGISKFVVRPATPPASLDEFLDSFTRELLPLQN